MLTAADLVTTVEWECPEGFRTHLSSRPAYDGRKGYDQDYGISDVNLWWTLVNPQGAVTWRMDTGWHLPHNTLELERRGYTQWSADIGQRDVLDQLAALATSPAQIYPSTLMTAGLMLGFVVASAIHDSLEAELGPEVEERQC